MTRGVRYHDLEALRAAVDAHVRSVVLTEKLGRPADHPEHIAAAELAAVVASVGSAAHWAAYRAALERCARAVEALADLEAALADVEAFAGVGPAARVRELLEGVRPIAEELPTPAPAARKRSARAVVLGLRGRRFWWGAEGPSMRDRALISILAGHWPERRVDAAKLRRGVTVAEVLRFEEQAIRAIVRERAKP